MRYLILFISFILIVSCNESQTQNDSVVAGLVPNHITYVLINEDTVNVNHNTFQDTLNLERDKYIYIKLESWKWPKLILAKKNRTLNLDFTGNEIKANEDVINSFLLNIDSFIDPYSLKWDMDEDEFRNTIKTELATNHEKIDSFFNNDKISDIELDELKQIETFKVAHRTANFISFQERKGKTIDRDIYAFTKDLNLNNQRLESQANFKNFQYYFLLDKIPEEIHDTVYPFAAIDTINKYSSLQSIRKMIISSVVKSSFYDEAVDHDKLLYSYEQNFGELEEGHPLLKIYNQIQKLKPGNPAPSIGELENLSGEFISLKDLKGKAFLLSVWGTWCPYCKEELPYLKTLIEKYGDTFTSVGISLDEDKEKWKQYIKENNWKGIHLIDPNRSSTFQSNYMISGTNTHYLIDSKGNIVSERGYNPSSKELEILIKDGEL